MTRLHTRQSPNLYLKLYNQKGGLKVYKGSMKRQRGGISFRPFAGMFKSLFKGVGGKAIKKIGKSVMKEVGPTVIKAALETGSSVLAGQNPKEAVKTAVRNTKKDLLKKGKKFAFDKIAQAASKQGGGRIDRRRTKSLAIIKRKKGRKHNIFGD